MRGTETTSFEARIRSRRPLFYTAGATQDRPAHVRAASGLTWMHIDGKQRLLAAQDDASFLAVIDPFQDVPHVEAITLDHVVRGQRLFEKERGNKKYKLDLEACLTLPIGGEEHGVVFGSGSLSIRETLVVVTPEGSTRIVDASALYALFHEAKTFSGSELNLEGATRIGEVVWLLQRGNGAPKGKHLPVDAMASIRTEALAAFLAGEAPPMLENITPYELGSINGVRLTFTDATSTPSGELIVLMGAEASPDAIEDGDVAGAAIGRCMPGQEMIWSLLREPDGTLSRAKVEGIAPHAPGTEGRYWVVVDCDDPNRPADLLDVELV